MLSRFYLSEIIYPLVILVFIYWYYHQPNKKRHFLNKIPGPPTIPLLGSALDFNSTEKILNTTTRYIKEYGEVVKIHIGPFRTFLLVSDYKIVESVLSSTTLLSKSYDYHFLKPWIGNGLLTSEDLGEKWKTHRRMLNTTFHYQILTKFVDVFESCGEKLNQKFEKYVGKDNVDIYPLVTLCSLDIICETAMGTSINAQDNENSDYVRSVKGMCRITIERSASPLQMYDCLFPLTKNYYTQKKLLNIIHTQTINVINTKREQLENKKEENENDETSFTKKKKAFLDYLLEAKIDGRPLTLEEIREEVDTFMFAGHDTTASTISFCLYCLANYPDVQERAFNEQKAIFGDIRNPDVTYADLQNMKYLKQVIKETLRLFPPIPLFAREIVEETQIGDNIIPQGVTLVIFAYGIQRNPKYFEDPETFNPSRFDEIDGKLPYAYIPFSAGPRNCIGQKFAILEIKSVISRVLRKFQLLPSIPKHELNLIAESTLKSTTGMKIRFKLRE